MSANKLLNFTSGLLNKSVLIKLIVVVSILTPLLVSSCIYLTKAVTSHKFTNKQPDSKNSSQFLTDPVSTTTLKETNSSTKPPLTVTFNKITTTETIPTSTETTRSQTTSTAETIISSTSTKTTTTTTLQIKKSYSESCLEENDQCDSLLGLSCHEEAGSNKTCQ